MNVVSQATACDKIDDANKDVQCDDAAVTSDIQGVSLNNGNSNDLFQSDIADGVDVNDDNKNDHNNDGVIAEVKDDDISVAPSSEIIKEQHDDKSLSGCWKLAERGKAGLLLHNGLLYHRAKILGQSFLQLVVPQSRREHVLKMGHDTYGGHMPVKRTKARISYTFYWPSLKEDCQKYIKTCRTCQLKAPVTYRDRVPIKAIPRADRVFDHWFIDCAGPLFTGEG